MKDFAYMLKSFPAGAMVKSSRDKKQKHYTAVGIKMEIHE